MSATAKPSSEPSVAFSFFRTVAIVLFLVGVAGAIEAMPTSGSVPDTPATASLTQSLKGFFTRLWSPGASDAEKLGTAYVYDEDGNLLSETGTGGANSSGTVNYMYAVHSDHLNTPRRLTDSQGQPAWQWAYSAFGDEKPTIAANRFANLDITPNPGTTNISPVVFNLGYMGMYRDEESGLAENGFRSYRAADGRYTQFDPIGLRGGPNGFTYVSGNPLKHTDPFGLAEYLGIDGIVAHLEKLSRAQGDDFWKVPWTGPERAMIQRLRQGKETPWDIGFYHHEKAEADMCRPYLDSPSDAYLRKQGEAHRQIEENQRNTQWDRYHPDVIRRFSDQFPTAPK